jgi:hypothetical protein
MSEDKKIPEFASYEEMADFVDSHDMADYWEQTEPAQFEMSPQARRRFLVPVDRDLILKIQKMARLRGLTTESLVNLFLEQHLKEIEVQT